MSFRFSTLASAALLGALMIAGTVIPAHAGDGCGKDKEKKDVGTTSLWTPAAPGATQAALTGVAGS